MTDMLQLATLDMQATTGLNDANLGRPKPDESGKAVLARQKQGDVATLNYSDNLARGIEYTGRAILDLVPKVYSAPRIQRIIKPDQTVSQVGIFNSKRDTQQEAQEAINNPEIKKLYDIASLDLMEREARRMRGARPFVFTNIRAGEGVAAVIDFIAATGGLPPRP